MSTHRLITSALGVAAVAAALVPAASAGAATGSASAATGQTHAVASAKKASKATLGRHHVKVASTYAYAKGPAVGWTGTLFKKNTFDVKRYSPSGKWAYGHAFGHVNRNVWVKASALGR